MKRRFETSTPNLLLSPQFFQPPPPPPTSPEALPCLCPEVVKTVLKKTCSSELLFISKAVEGFWDLPTTMSWKCVCFVPGAQSCLKEGLEMSGFFGNCVII